MKGKASAAATFAEVVQNTYGWNVMKPEVIDRELWDDIYQVYVQDRFGLGIREYFEKQNPAALEEMTAVMMETVRKGMWKASDQQLQAIARLHTELVGRHQPSCSDFVCNNAPLQDFIASKVTPETGRRYKEDIRNIREAALSDRQGMVLQREELNATEKVKTRVSNVVVAAVAAAAIVILLLVVRQRRKKMRK